MSFVKKILSRIRGEQNLQKLINRGLKIGPNHTIMSGAIIDPAHCWHIEIGDYFWMGHYSQIIAHDASTKPFLNCTRVANVIIGNRVFIGAAVIILPGVTIGNDVVIGSGSLVSKDIPSNSLAVGSPAKVICTLEAYIEKQKLKMNSDNAFGYDYTLRNPNFSDEHKRIMVEACEKYGEAFVE